MGAPLISRPKASTSCETGTVALGGIASEGRRNGYPEAHAAYGEASDSGRQDGKVFDARRVFLGAMKKKLVPLRPGYVHELEVLGAMLKQEDRQGDSGWGGAWAEERYRDLSDRGRSGTGVRY